MNGLKTERSDVTVKATRTRLFIVQVLAALFLLGSAWGLYIPDANAGSLQNALKGVIAKKNTPSGSAAYCTGAATCTATNPGECDLVCEDFEGSTSCDGDGDAYCRNGWTLGGTDTVWTWNDTPAASNLCSGTTSTRSIKAVITTGSGGAALKTFTATPDIHFQFYFTPVSINFTVNGQWTKVLGFQAVRDCYVTIVQISEGVYRLQMIYRGSDFEAHFLTPAVDLSVNTMYRAYGNLHANGTVSFTVNSTTVNSTTNALDDYSFTSVYFGPDGMADANTTYQVDNLAVDNDTDAGACQ